VGFGLIAGFRPCVHKKSGVSNERFFSIQHGFNRDFHSGRVVAMTSRMVIVLASLLLWGMAACKSKETTSAVIHNDTGRYDLAIQQCMIALEKNPNDAEAYFQLGVAHSNLDSVEMAYNEFMKSATLDPKKQKLANDNIQSNFAKHYNHGLNFSNEKNLLGAATEFLKATKSDPRQSSGYYMLGKAYQLLGTADSTYYAKAVTALDKVLELSSPADKQYIDALSTAGEVFVAMGQPEEAITRFNRLIEEDPTNYRVIEKIGYDLLDQENWRGAAVFLELAAQARSKIGSEDFNLYYNIGVAYFQARKEDDTALVKSVDYYKRALELQPDDPQTVFNLVVASSAARDWQQVVAWGEKYVSIDADNKDAWRLMASAYNELGNEAKARECAGRYDQIQKRGSQ
jgi:tetratricopeptide (TPR) repeat protein